MTATGICYCLEISLNGTTVALTFFGVLDVRGVTPNRGEGVQCLSASDLGSRVRRQDAGEGVFLELRTTTVFADQNKKGLPSKMPCKPFIYIWCPEPGSNRHVQRTRDFKSLASTNFAIGAVAPRAGNIYTRPP
ncbi:Uncharacterized protein ALO64_02937 [Pseudomonas meliae]|uniref:Uncharacterized protein n=1 Tax=Pseudomonas meliae TaxID=86176 RepID=A0A0N8S2J6_9PSED|nr:Uncharacterized protein ALO64_02937 [Pseudomonas meliae]